MMGTGSGWTLLMLARWCPREDTRVVTTTLRSPADVAGGVEATSGTEASEEEWEEVAEACTDMVEVAASTATTTMDLIMEVEVVLEDEEVTMIGGKDLGRTLMDPPAG